MIDPNLCTILLGIYVVFIKNFEFVTHLSTYRVLHTPKVLPLKLAPKPKLRASKLKTTRKTQKLTFLFQGLSETDKIKMTGRPRFHLTISIWVVISIILGPILRTCSGLFNWQNNSQQVTNTWNFAIKITHHYRSERRRQWSCAIFWGLYDTI